MEVENASLSEATISKQIPKRRRKRVKLQAKEGGSKALKWAKIWSVWKTSRSTWQNGPCLLLS